MGSAGHGGGVGRRGEFKLLFIVAGGLAFGQANSWTNPSSARWEDPFWSLGMLPMADQSVVITNDGWKAVGIFPSTPLNYPASMTVQDLRLSAIPGSFNRLLLNYSGTDRPL